MKWELSCGAVVFTRTRRGLRFVLAQSRSGQYGFPKGHMEAGEAETDTALREIREEVGLTPTLLPGFRMESRYSLPGKEDTWKQVVFFLAEYEDQTIVPLKSELMGAPLVSYRRAMELLTHEANRRILRRAMRFLRQMEQGAEKSGEKRSEP